jgi:hypothetical protein
MTLTLYSYSDQECSRSSVALDWRLVRGLGLSVATSFSPMLVIAAVGVGWVSC